MGNRKHLVLPFTNMKCPCHMPCNYSTGHRCMGELFMCSSDQVAVTAAVQGTRRLQVLQIPQIPMARGPPSSSVLHRTLLRLKCRGLFRLLIICRRMSWWATWCGSSKCSSFSSWMAAPPSLCRGNHLEVEILAEVAQGNTIKPPIGISHPRWTAVAEISATQRNQVPPVISNSATAGTTTIRMTGVATDTMTAEVATNIMARGVAAVATKIIDGDDIETQRDFCKDFSPSQICGQLT